ncbi:MAG: restriction endonuclease subunit S [Pseudomonadota bacterium]
MATRKTGNLSEIVRLGSVISINPDSVGKHFPFETINYIDISSVGSGTLNGITEIKISEAPSRARRMVKSADTILSTVRPNRRSFLFVKCPVVNTVVSTGFAVVRAKDEINPRFLYYTITHQPFTDYLTNNAKGAAYPAVDTDTIARAEIWLPPLPTQHKIASILSAYDDLIENNLRRIKILEEMAQALYREWFVKFRFPGHEKVRMVNSPLGKIPEGWEVVKLGERVTLLYGKGLTKSDRKEGDVPVFGSSGVVGRHNRSIVRGPGIIVGRKGNVGSVFWSDTDFYPIDTVFYTKTDLPMHYVYYNLRHQNFINNDAAVPGLNRNQAHSLPFIVPEKRILCKFSESADLIFRQTMNLNRRAMTLRQTRDLLLPRLISGELDVSDLEINIPAEVA